jgi:hypothetical protein
LRRAAVMSGTKLDRQRLTRIVAMCGSRHDGEALNAVRLADRIIQKAGLTWEDLLAPYAQLQVAVEAARVLLDENTSLRAELERQRSNSSSFVEWREVGPASESIRAAAEWVLDLYVNRLCWLSAFEIDFVKRCMNWVGALPPGEQPVFRRIVTRIAERTGLTPPL